MSTEHEAGADDSVSPAVPDNLQDDNHTVDVIRDRIWLPPNRYNDWVAFVMVGREGSGKSHTTARILEEADPTFDASRVFFDPVELVRFIRDTPEEERAGKAIMLDEAGVGMGVRSWYEEEQIKVNKAFQTLRDDNMIIGLTLPSFSLLDSQLRTRLHGYCEMWEVHEGEHAVWSWKDIIVDRSEKKKEIKRKMYPRKSAGNRTLKLKRLGLGPPSEEFINEYERRKAEFKQQYMDDIVEEDDDGEESPGPKEIAEKILNNGVINQFTSIHGGRGTEYVDKDKIHLEYDHLTHQEAQMVKKLLADEWESE